MPKPTTFEPGSQYVMDSIAYEVIRVLADDSVVTKNLQNQQLGSQPLAKLSQAWQEGTLKFTTIGENLCDISGLHVKTTYEFDDIRDLPLQVKEETWNRYLLIKPLLNLPPPQRSSETIEDAIHEFFHSSEKGKQQAGANLLGTHVGKNRKSNSQKEEEEQPSVRSVQRWIQRFEKNGDIRNLVPSYHHRGPQKLYLSPVVEELIKKAVQDVYLQDERAPVTSVITRVNANIIKANENRIPSEQLKKPGKMTIYRYLQRLDPFEVDLARFGPTRARRNHKQTWNGPQPTRPNQQVEFDFAFLDIIVVDAVDRLPIGKPTIAVLRDRYTGYILGFFISFEPPSYHLVMECMLYAFLPKPHIKSLFETKNDYLAYGIPGTLIVDNGIELDRDLEMACVQLGIELVHLPVRKPWFKGRIERWFRTLNTGVIHITPGTTFSNILERGEYHSEHHACITIDELCTALHLWLVDDYAQSPHRGIGDGHGVGNAKRGIPAKLWQRAREQGFVPKLPPSRDDLLVLISRTTRRTVQQYGIDVENIRYQSDALGTIRSDLAKQKQQRREHPRKLDNEYDDGKVQIKYNPGDLSRIWVLDETKDYKHYIEVKALDEVYTQGLSLWKHRLIVQYAREQLERDLNADDLVLAKARLQDYISQKFRTNKHLRSRQRCARFLDDQVSTWLHNSSAQNTDSITHLSPDPFLNVPPVIETSFENALQKEKGEEEEPMQQEFVSEQALSALEMSVIDPPASIAGVTLLQEAPLLLESLPSQDILSATTVPNSKVDASTSVSSTIVTPDEIAASSTTTTVLSDKKKSSSKKKQPKRSEVVSTSNPASAEIPKVSPEEEFAAFGITVSYYQRKKETSL